MVRTGAAAEPVRALVDRPRGSSSSPSSSVVVRVDLLGLGRRRGSPRGSPCRRRSSRGARRAPRRRPPRGRPGRCRRPARRPRRSGRRRRRRRGRASRSRAWRRARRRPRTGPRSRRRPVSSSSSSAGVEALGQPADDVDRRGQLLDGPAVGALGGDVVDAVEVEAVVVVRGQVGGTEAGHDRPDRVVGEVVVGAGAAERRERRGGGEEVDDAVRPVPRRRPRWCRGTPATPRRPPPTAEPTACSRCGRRG